MVVSWFSPLVATVLVFLPDNSVSAKPATAPGDPDVVATSNMVIAF
jgi:hypothetical protein